MERKAQNNHILKLRYVVLIFLLFLCRGTALLGQEVCKHQDDMRCPSCGFRWESDNYGREKYCPSCHRDVNGNMPGSQGRSNYNSRAEAEQRKQKRRRLAAERRRREELARQQRIKDAVKTRARWEAEDRTNIKSMSDVLAMIPTKKKKPVTERSFVFQDWSKCPPHEICKATQSLQERIDKILRKKPLTPKDEKLFLEYLNEQKRIIEAAIRRSDLTQKERIILAQWLPSYDMSPKPPIPPAMSLSLPPNKHVAPPSKVALFVSKQRQAILGVGQSKLTYFIMKENIDMLHGGINQLWGKTGKLTAVFGGFFDSLESGVAATGDMLIGLGDKTGAFGFALSGGRKVGHISELAFDRFINTVNTVSGIYIDPKEFKREIREQMNFGQRVVAKFCNFFSGE